MLWVVQPPQRSVSPRRTFPLVVSLTLLFSTLTIVQSFYSEFRRTHTHYMLRTDTAWYPETMDEWLAKPSSKLHALVELIQWHLGEDNRPPLKVDEVTDEKSYTKNSFSPNPHYEPRPRPEGLPPDKIVVYFAFPSNNGLLTAVRGFVFSFHFI